MDPSSIISAPLATFPESVNDESAGSPEPPNRAVDNGEAGTVLQLPWVEPSWDCAPPWFLPPYPHSYTSEP